MVEHELAIADRVREEHTRVNHLAEQVELALEEFATACDAPRLERVRERFEHLRAHLHKHIALEERDGYLLPVLERRPTLSPEVEHLRGEHREQLALANQVHAQLGTATIDAGNRLEDCTLRIRHLLSEIRHHRETEALLVTSVFSVDLGGED